MTIRNLQKFNAWKPAGFDGQFHWDFMFSAFRVPFSNGKGMSDRFQPMDIDAVVERKGHILIFETKEPGKQIDPGQAFTLHALWQKGATIVHLSGKSPVNICGMAAYKETEQNKHNTSIGSRPLEECDGSDVVFFVRQWMCFANGDPIPNRNKWDADLWAWDAPTNAKAS